MAKHGRYKIVRKVADGGMAEIFLAMQLGREGFQKPVILKRIHSAIYADPQFRNMFIDEAHISMGLSHSNIVQVLDLGLGGGRYFLVMELVDGWDLGRIIQRATAARMPLLPELGLHVTAEICRALAYAHGKAQFGNPLGIVHRDVSPHNVLISEQGEVKLADFGIAKAMNKREQTGTGVVKGKVAFMSPEQALGKAIDARSDLFSLGILLYQLMTGVRPFEGPTDLEILLRVQKAEFRPPEEANPDMEPELAQIMIRAMRLDPADRYQTADEMLNDIERVLRTVFRPAGQSELKRWLADLQREDGAPSIGKAPAIGPAVRTGTGELDGKDVELSDSEQELGEDNTSLATLDETDGRPRLNRHRVTELPLPVPEDDELEMSGRHSQSELTLPISEMENEQPGRRRKSRTGRWVSVLLVGGVLLIVGAALAGSYLGSRSGDENGARGAEGNPPPPGAPVPPPSSEAPPVPTAAAPPTAAAAAPSPSPASPAATPPAIDPGVAGKPVTVNPATATPPTAPLAGTPAATATPPGTPPAGTPPAGTPPAGSAPAPAPRDNPREVSAGARKTTPRSEPGRAIIELKNMMQPDPSQLPPTPAPTPSSPAPSPPAIAPAPPAAKPSETEPPAAPPPAAAPPAPTP
jgi:serine/threonine protein kinase